MIKIGVHLLKLSQK